METTNFDGKLLIIKSVEFNDVDIHQSFYTNGMMEYEAEMRNGVPDRKVKYWNLKGKLVNVTNYENGKLHGSSIRYYNNGKLASRVNYFYGKIHGKSETFHENGNIQSNQAYDYGKPITKLIRFDINGEYIYQP